jgi:hypothetical protein
MNKLYTLDRLAEIEGTTQKSLHVMLHRMKKKGEPPFYWRGWKLINVSSKVWLAVEQGSDVEIVD